MVTDGFTSSLSSAVIADDSIGGRIHLTIQSEDEFTIVFPTRILTQDEFKEIEVLDCLYI